MGKLATYTSTWTRDDTYSLDHKLQADLVMEMIHQFAPPAPTRQDVPGTAEIEKKMRQEPVGNGNIAQVISACARVAHAMTDWRDVVERLRAGTRIRDDFWLNPLPLAVEAAALIERQAGEIERLRAVLGYVDTWVSNPVGVYSVAALDGLFATTRDRISAALAPDTPDT